jgi:hypothetical protein
MGRRRAKARRVTTKLMNANECSNADSREEEEELDESV